MSEPSYEKLIKNEDFINSVALAIAKSPRIQLLILESVVKNVATKDDIRELRHYVDVRIGDLDKRIDSLDKRIDSLDKRIDGLDKRISLLQWVIAIGFTILSVILSVLTFAIMTLPR